MSAQIYSYFFYLIFFGFLLPFSVLTATIIKTNVATGLNAFVIVSKSMNPAVPMGSVIYTKKDTVYHKGDIIAFLQKGKTISHRIERIVHVGSQIYYSTKGDANYVTDFDLVTSENTLGKAVFFLPYIGELIVVLRNQNLLLLGAVLPTLLLIYVLRNSLRF